MTNSVTPRPVVLLVLVLAGGILAGCATAVTITTPVLPDGRVGEPYDFQLEADGGDSWSVVTGTLPTGNLAVCRGPQTSAYCLRFSPNLKRI